MTTEITDGFLGTAGSAAELPAPGVEGLGHRYESGAVCLAADAPVYVEDGVAVYLRGCLTATTRQGYAQADRLEDPAAELARAYRTRGSEMGGDLDGYFLCIIHDQEAERVLLVNNRYLATNCYYFDGGEGGLVVADSLSRLLKSLPEQPPFDPDLVPSFLSSGFSWSDRGPFQGVRRLPPAHTLGWSAQGVETRGYWRPKFVRGSGMTDPEAEVDRYEGTLRGVIGDYLKASRTERLGCYLSGGQDSSLVYLLASRCFDSPIHTFTASFASPVHDETGKAREVSDLGGGIHHSVPVTADCLDEVPALVRTAEEPCSGGSLPMFLCAREAARHCDTILTGDGGDLLWGQYYPVVEWHRYLRHLPGTARRGLHRLARLARRVTNWERLWEWEFVVSLFKEKDPYPGFFRKMVSYRHFDEEARRALLNHAMLIRTKPAECSYTIDVRGETFHDDLIHSKLVYGHHYYPASWTGRSLEQRGVRFFQPYVTRPVIDLINSLPLDALNRGSSLERLANRATSRWLHKRLLARFVDLELLGRMQQLFNMPFHSWFGQRADVLRELKRRLLARGWYREGAVERLFAEYSAQEASDTEPCPLADHGYRIYSLLTLEVFCMEFVDGRRFRPLEQVSLEEYLSD